MWTFFVACWSILQLPQIWLMIFCSRWNRIEHYLAPVAFSHIVTIQSFAILNSNLKKCILNFHSIRQVIVLTAIILLLLLEFESKCVLNPIHLGLEAGIIINHFLCIFYFWLETYNTVYWRCFINVWQTDCFL